jgi:hypothetical protein
MLRSPDRYFRLRENRSSTRPEVLGGLTTFATTAYIIVANPRYSCERQLAHRAKQRGDRAGRRLRLMGLYNIANGLTAGLGVGQPH